ncbi:hypothetical protein GCM10011329_33760 [Stakelama pacifica]|nr:hypothetical protein GCM10011329_33760 [Stakelama pacifica]
MRDDLMPEQIEIDPAIGAAPFGTAEHLPIEMPRGIEVVYREGEMKGSDSCHAPHPSAARTGFDRGFAERGAVCLASGGGRRDIRQP